MNKGKNTSKNRKQYIMVGLLCLVGGVFSHSYGWTFLSWLLFSVGVFGTISTLTQPWFNEEQSSENFGLSAALIVASIGLYYDGIMKSDSGWDVALFWVLIVFFSSLAIYGLLSVIQSVKLRVVARSVVLLCFSGALATIYARYAKDLFPANVIIMFLAVDNLRRALSELTRSRQLENGIGLFILPDAVVFFSLLYCSWRYADELLFHMAIVFSVLALFRFSLERFIPETTIRERKKLDTEVEQHERIVGSFFSELTGSHAKINFLMLPLLLMYLFLPIEQYVIQSEVVSNVFQASIGLIGILIGFSTLILSGRVRKNEAGWERQSYILHGLLGVIFLFVVIAMVAFFGMSLKGSVEQKVNIHLLLPVQDGLLDNSQLQLQLIVIMLTEFVFFAIPAALVYFFSLSRDLLERYETPQSRESPTK